MADNNSRAARLNDPYRQGGAAPSANAQGGDPLAELARLIGQTDPFAEFGQDSRANDPRAKDPRSPLRAAVTPLAGWDEPAPTKYVQMTPPQGGYAPQAQAQAQQYAEPQYSAQAYAQQPAQAGYHDPQQAYHDPHQGYQDQQPYADQQAGYPAQGYAEPQNYADPQHYADPHVGTPHDPYQPPTYNGPGYAAAEPAQHGYQPDPYYDDRQARPDEEIYDDLPPRRRRGAMLTVVAVLCLAVVGTAGAFAYRSFLGGSRGTTPPPVIKADTAPSKVVPAQTNDKLIQDRIAGAPPQGERVVSREEQPVEMKDPRAVPARMVFPPSAPDTTASAPNAAVGEPKRIRTVTIRPDMEGNPVTSETPRAPRPAAPQAPAAPRAAPPVQLSPQAVQAPQAQPAPAASASRGGSGPLSLAPAAANEPQQRQMTTAGMPPQLAAAGSGAYLVQVSSQRSENDAMASFRALQSRFPAQLGSRNASVRRADLGDKGIYFRSMVGPFGSADQANQFCGELKAAGGQCIVTRN